jgi:AraC-like DNA-binding protein
MDDLTFLHGSRTERCRAVVDKHFDGYYTLQFMAQGAIDLFYDRERLRLEGRWCWPCFPGPWTRFRLAEGCPWWEHRYVAVRGPQVVRWVAEGLFPKAAQRAPDDRSFDADFDRLHLLMAQPDRWSQRRAVHLFEGLLLQLAQERATDAGGQPWLERVLATIQRPEPYAVAKLAREAGMAVSTLRRRFREATGESLHAHALACRLANARRLLVDGIPIKAICDQLGYADVSFFTKQFTRHVGVSPGAFRKTRTA